MVDQEILDKIGFDECETEEAEEEDDEDDIFFNGRDISEDNECQLNNEH